MNQSPLTCIKPKDFILDLRYTTTNNFTGKKVFHRSGLVIRKELEPVIKKIIARLDELNLRLVVWDAYRTQAEQDILRLACSDDKYVSVVSNHERGITLDVTLADKEGNYLDMGTGFDGFSEVAYADHAGLSAIQKNNRHILSNTMKNNGFKENPYEWWHYDFIKMLDSPVLSAEDIPKLCD